MALPDGDNLSHRLIQDELANSSMVPDKSSFNNMVYYVFGIPHEDPSNMRMFANRGIPEMQTDSLSGNALEGGIELTFTVSNWGGFTPCRIFANYWKTGGQQNFKQIGEVQSDGTYTMDLTQLDGGAEYNVRVCAENKFNNAGNFPNHPNEDHFSFAYTTTTKDPLVITTNDVPPDQPDPPIIVRTWWISGNDFGVDWNYDSTPDEFFAEFRLTTPSNQYDHSPSDAYYKNNWGAVSNPKTGEWAVDNMAVPSSDDYVQVRLQAFDDNSGEYSPWTEWLSAGFAPPQDVQITSDSNRDVTATWNNPPLYNQTESLSDSINPVIQWFEEGSWGSRISLANGAESATKDYAGSGVAQCRVTYETNQGDTSEMQDSNSITFDEPENLGFREESGSTLYAEWDNTNTLDPIELQVEQNGSWGGTISKTRGDTEHLIGGNIPSGYEFRFRVRYEGSSVWVTSSIYTM